MWSRYDVPFKERNKRGSLLITINSLRLLGQNTLKTALTDVQDQNETLEFQHDEGEPADVTWC